MNQFGDFNAQIEQLVDNIADMDLAKEVGDFSESGVLLRLENFAKLWDLLAAKIENCLGKI